MIAVRPGIATELGQIRRLLGGRAGPILALALISLLAGLSESGILAIVAQGAGAMVAGRGAVRLNLGPLRAHESVEVLLLAAIGLALLRLALQGLLATIPARIAADIQARARSAVFAAFTRASWSEQSQDREGHLQEILTGQSTNAVFASLQGALLVVSMTSFVVLVLSAIALDPVAAGLVLVAAAGFFLLLRPLASVGTQSAHSLSRALLRFAGGVSEAIRVAEETHVFGVGDAQRQRMDDLTEEVRRPFFRTQMLARLVPGVYQSLIYLLVAGGLLGLYLSGAGLVASLGAVVLLLVRAGSYGQQCQGAYQGVRQGIPFFDRVEETRKRYETNISVRGHHPLEQIASITFDGVSFSYDRRRPVLRNVSFAVDQQETIGIMGPTGAGKSTLVQILLGLRHPASGSYLVNQLPAVDYRAEDWQRKVAYLPQEPRLLHASVTDNIRFFRDLDDEAIERAARLAGIHEDVLSWAEGYDTLVGPRADAVSGGQQQRICLARALATDPELLILDEPTSALDPRTELLIQESLRAIKDQLTLFIVAHRISTLSICDRVMVITDGRLEAFDTVSALASTSDYYRTASAVGVATLGASQPSESVAP